MVVTVHNFVFFFVLDQTWHTFHIKTAMENRSNTLLRHLSLFEEDAWTTVSVATDIYAH